jgi:hypothetical protein
MTESQKEADYARLAAEQLEHLSGSTEVTLVAIPLAGPIEARTIKVADRARLQQWIEQRFGRSNIYFQVNPLWPSSRNRKGKKTDIAHVVQLHVDIDDPKGLERLQAFSLPPTAIVSSGNGFHGYWRLNTPTTDFHRAESLNRALSQALQGDTAHDISRILRVPHTLNIPTKKKAAQGRVPVMSSLVEALTDFSRTYGIDQLESALAPSLQTGSTLSCPSPDIYRQLPARLNDVTSQLIVTGGKVGNDGYKSRSEVVHRVTCDLVRAGMPDAEIMGVLTNPTYGISASILDKTNPRAYAERQVKRAKEVVRRGWADIYKNGRPRPSLKNAQIAIQRLGITCSCDFFRHRLYVDGLEVQQYNGELTDNICAAVRNIVLDKFSIDMTKEHIRDAVHMLALENGRDSLLDYLNSLQWDGESRISDFLIRYFGAEDTAFNRSIGRKMLIAAVRRARQPGVKYDTVVVFEGAQGTGKSTALEILAGRENFSDQDVLSLDTKGHIETLEGVWILELSELDGLKRADIARVKAFISRTEDRARPAYGRSRENRPRRNIFAGTTNEDQYLRDTTGNRRFWPVKIGEIDLNCLKRDRDQIWAEAVCLEKKGEPIALEKELYPVAAELQAQRLEQDAWLEVLSEIEGEVIEGEERIGTGQILLQHLRIPADRQSAAIAKRLATVMRQLGWEGPKGMRIGHNPTVRGYSRRARHDGPPY